MLSNTIKAKMVIVFVFIEPKVYFLIKPKKQQLANRDCYLVSIFLFFLYRAIGKICFYGALEENIDYYSLQRQTVPFKSFLLFHLVFAC